LESQEEVRFTTHLLGNTTKHQLLPIDLLAAVNLLCAPPIPAAKLVRSRQAQRRFKM
jgi:hypothetical protein